MHDLPPVIQAWWHFHTETDHTETDQHSAQNRLSQGQKKTANAIFPSSACCTRLGC